MLFKGSGVALVTPFKKENVYEVDFDTLEKLISFQLENKTDAIVVCGTTGESATLTDNEKYLICSKTKNIVHNRVPVIAGTGSNDTAHAMKLAKMAEEVGVDGLLIVTPYYNKCTQNGLIKHYQLIASSVKIPIIVYNVPSRTGVNILPETVLELAKIPNVVGIKEASADLLQIKKIIELVKKEVPDFQVFSGNDDEIYDVLNLGGDGVISVLANIRPKDTHEICNSYFLGDKEKSKYLQETYMPLIKALFNEVNPIPVKDALQLEGFSVGALRLPLTNAEKNTTMILKRELEKTNK